MAVPLIESISVSLLLTAVFAAKKLSAASLRVGSCRCNWFVDEMCRASQAMMGAKASTREGIASGHDHRAISEQQT
jgi:hypothetical protein